MTIGEILKEKREQLGYTQKEVAQKLYVSRQTVSNWEIGKTYPDIEKLLNLSDFYGLSLDELIKEDYRMADKLKRDSYEQKIRVYGFLSEQLSAMILGSILTCVFFGVHFSMLVQIILIVVTFSCLIFLLWRNGLVEKIIR
ncbi:helix-turn-helix domain-containing protein [Enterococcus plantarum]|uniref:helix-turn-helix domain-containing protein n=1 Tax=Enterococcus TaxID=1350 RepID=UPI001A8C577F|nr:helix-turn-helix transcriptional regulator [Enterococcus plantarum]MBO0421675.1 helix-turn-helix transcriptional regulator [Enterococcus plantarum]MBO0468099.1 helix-turn-helix transcriptional regulator [Enterococcus plantarum]